MHIRACTLALILSCGLCVLASDQLTAASTSQPDYSTSRSTNLTTSAHADGFDTGKKIASANPQDAAAPQGRNPLAAPARSSNPPNPKDAEKEGATPKQPAKKSSDLKKDYCSDPENQPIDCRDNFEGNAYIGVSVDNSLQEN